VATKLTKRTLDALESREKPFIVFDGGVPGFGVRVMPSGAKSFCVEYRPHGGGRTIAKKRLTLGRYGAMTVDQARTAALTALARVRLGEDPQGEKARQRGALSVAGLIDTFLEGHVQKLKPRTRVSYEAALAKLRAAHGGSKAAALTRAQLTGLHRSMADAPYAANRALAVISSLYAWAINQGLLPEGHANPATKIGRYRELARERFLTGEELARLGAALRMAEPKTPFVVAAIRLLILTGARMSEILHARWEHIDTERAIIFFPDSKTGRKPVYLSAAALTILSELPRLKGNPHVFPSQKVGAPRVKLHSAWVPIRKAAGLDGVRIHDLRHSFASIGAGASLGLPIIGKLLGHSQPSTTARYAHLGASPMHAAVETIGQEIVAALDGHILALGGRK
jgi:integrase